MKYTKKKLLILTAIIFTLPTAHAKSQSNADVLEQLITTAKFTGGCGIFRQQALFQESTQMKGGSEFMNRFWTTEAARLGMSLLEYAQYCHKATERFMEDSKTIENMK